MTAYKHFFQEMCNRVNYNSIVFFEETSEVIAYHLDDYLDTAKKCTISVQLDELGKENSDVFYGQSLIIDQRVLLCSGSVNRIQVDDLHIVIVFFDLKVTHFKNNQLPRILWKNINHLYLGHSEYVPHENNLQHSMVGFTDDELFLENAKDSFKSKDEAVFLRENCYWNTIGTIKANQVTSMITYHKFPFYSFDNQVIGSVLVYQPINESVSLQRTDVELSPSEIDLMINQSLSASKIIVMIQNYKTKKIEFISSSIEKYGLKREDVLQGKVKFLDIIHPLDIAYFKEQMNQVVYINKTNLTITLRLVNIHKHEHSAKITVVPSLSNQKTIHHLSIIVEVNDYLSDDSKKYQILNSLTSKGHIIYTLRNYEQRMKFDYITTNISQFGYTMKEVVSNDFDFTNVVHHEDIDKVKREFQKIDVNGIRQIHLDYRLVSSRQNIYWVEEKAYLVEIEGSLFIETMIRNITSSKRALDELNRLNSIASKQSLFDNRNRTLEIHFDHILSSIDLEKQMKEFSNKYGIDCFFFNNSDEVVLPYVTSENGLTVLNKILLLHQIDSIKDVKIVENGIFINCISVENRAFRVGSMVLLAHVSGEADHYFDVPLSSLNDIPINALDNILSHAHDFAKNLGYFIYFTALGIFQTQTSSVVKGDLVNVRKKHEILLELLSAANKCESIERCFDTTFERIAQVFELSRGALFIYHSKTDDYEGVKEWLLADEVSHLSEYKHIKIDKTVFAHWHLNEQTSYVIDYDDEVSEEYQMRKYANAIIGVKINYQDKVYGIITFVDNHSHRIWSDDDIMLFEDIAYVFSYIVEKTLNQEKLRINQIQLYETLNALPNAVSIFNKVTKEILYANTGFYNVFPNGQLTKLQMELVRKVVEDDANKKTPKELYLEKQDKWYVLEKTQVDFGYEEQTCMVIFTDITNSKKYAESIADLAFHDVLSGLPNRVKFELDLETIYEQSSSNYVNAFIGILNIDNFKMINNTYSYSFGDSIIQALAKLLNQIPELYGNVYRFGGDEFAFIVQNAFGEQVYEVCQNIMEIFEKPFYVEGYESFVTVSLGIGFLIDTDKDKNGLIRKTNLSLLEAKSSGKNKFVLYDASLQKYEKDTLYMESVLKTSIDAGCQEFEVYFQPIVESKTGKIIAAEALTRWFSKELGFVPPVKFIPIAESTGFIIPLGKYILNQACKEARKWLDYGYDIQVSVNFSVIQTLQSDLITTIISALNTHKIPPKNLLIEITESLAIKDVNKMVNILNEVRQIGVKIAMDDFGTGYSSLSHLRKLPLDYVKIDRSFTLNLEYDPYFFSFIETITVFCHLNNTNVCVEGVENENQKKLLQKTAVDHMQGYLFGQPKSSNDFFRILAQTNKK